jgi:hypothetical protein
MVPLGGEAVTMAWRRKICESRPMNAYIYEPQRPTPNFFIL